MPNEFFCNVCLQYYHMKHLGHDGGNRKRKCKGCDDRIKKYGINKSTDEVINEANSKINQDGVQTKKRKDELDFVKELDRINNMYLVGDYE
jgi:hypothetical protein